jgi:hypothetical protein
MRKIKVRGDIAPDGHSGDVEFYNGFDICAENGEVVYSLRMSDDGILEVCAHGFARFNGKVYEDHICVRPQDSGRVLISRDEYVPASE